MYFGVRELIVFKSFGTNIYMFQFRNMNPFDYALPPKSLLGVIHSIEYLFSIHCLINTNILNSKMHLVQRVLSQRLQPYLKFMRSTIPVINISTSFYQFSIIKKKEKKKVLAIIAVVFKLLPEFWAPEKKISPGAEIKVKSFSVERKPVLGCAGFFLRSPKGPLSCDLVKRAAAKVHNFSGLRYQGGHVCSHTEPGHLSGRECHFPTDGKSFVVNVSAVVLF